MSAIVCFDIRNFSTHVSHLSEARGGASKKVFAAVEEIFGSLDQEVRSVSTTFGFSNKTYVIHSGDGFVAIFYGKGNCLQGLLVASLLATRVEKILAKYNRERDRHGITESLPSLDYGMGIHIGPVHKFNYQPVYQPGNKTVGVGLLGHAINMANRVQEATKDHTYRIICTKRVFTEGIAAVNAKERRKFEKWFTSLGSHKLRGMKNAVTLYGVDPDLGLNSL